MTARAIKVIVIETNSHLRRLIGTVLGALPIAEIVEARCTDSATPLLREHDPHLVIMDWSGDHTEGLLFVHRLRTGEIGRRDTPVLALSTSLHHAVLEQAQEAGIDEVIAKPISAREIIRHAAMLIDASRRRAGFCAA